MNPCSRRRELAVRNRYNGCPQSIRITVRNRYNPQRTRCSPGRFKLYRTGLNLERQEHTKLRSITIGVIRPRPWFSSVQKPTLIVVQLPRDAEATKRTYGKLRSVKAR